MDLNKQRVCWNEEITNFLKSIGFIQYKSDKCLFGKYNKEK